MQGIPTIHQDYPMTQFEYVITIVILVVIVIIMGYRNQTTKPIYWVLSIIEVAVLAIFWLFLAVMINAFIFSHVSLAVEIKPIIVDILNILIYVGFCILVIVIEKHRGVPKTESETSVVICE